MGITRILNKTFARLHVCMSIKASQSVPKFNPNPSRTGQSLKSAYKEIVDVPKFNLKVFPIMSYLTLQVGKERITFCFSYFLTFTSCIKFL